MWQACATLLHACHKSVTLSLLFVLHLPIVLTCNVSHSCFTCTACFCLKHGLLAESSTYCIPVYIPIDLSI